MDYVNFYSGTVVVKNPEHEEDGFIENVLSGNYAVYETPTLITLLHEDYSQISSYQIKYDFSFYSESDAIYIYDISHDGHYPINKQINIYPHAIAISTDEIIFRGYSNNKIYAMTIELNY